MPSPLELLKRVILSGEENLPQLKSALQHIMSRQVDPTRPNDWNRVIMANEMPEALQFPDIKTHLFLDSQGRAQGAYQLSDKGGILHLLSDQPGLGKHLLEDAYRNSPSKPVSLYSLPESRGFYEKQPGWIESSNPGEFIKKASGGRIRGLY